MKKLLLIALACIASAPVMASGLPQANFTVSPAVGRVGSEFQIDARQSRNSAGNLGGVEIRFKYDGGNWTDWSRRTLQKFSPLDTGNMRVNLQVRDIKTNQVQSTYRSIKVVSSWNRRAWISVEDNSAEVGEPVDFRLELALMAADDPDTVQVRWDFDNDGGWDTTFSRQKFVSHVFDTAVTASPRAEVKFADGEILEIEGIAPRREPGSRRVASRSSWQKLRITSPVIVAPIVDVSPGSTGFSEKTTFTFTASNVRIPRGGWIEWSFDGQQWLRFPRKTEAVHQFTSPGKHEVRTRVCIGYSQPRCEETTTQVMVNRDATDFRTEIFLQNRTNPSGAYWSTQNSQYFVPVEVGDRIRFTSRLLQYGGAGQRFQYRWDFNNDGRWDTHFSTQSYSEHVFDRGGEFVVRVAVRNEDGVTVEATRRILVTNNEKPVAEIGISQDAIYQGERVRFAPVFPEISNGLTSERSTTQVRFDLDGDGLWESDFRGVSGADWVYNQVGEVTVRMQLRDRGKNVTTVSKKIYINPLPTVAARVTVSARTVQVGEVVKFDASESVGRKLRYVWDFDSSGALASGAMWSGRGSTSPTVSYTWREGGEKMVSLLVIDETGKGDQIFFPVTVSDSSQVSRARGMTRWSLMR